MPPYDLDDTIAAIATPIGESGIGIIRISGKGALSVADKVFVPKNGIAPSGAKAYTTHYGWIRRPPESSFIDEVILTVMRSPKSFTKEDTVEINCHGGICALRQVLDAVLENGCRLAHPGEFTKRAFLNGRIDLAQAEAVLDIIQAKTDAALKIGEAQLEGELSRSIHAIRTILVDALAQLEARIEFPEETMGERALPEASAGLLKAHTALAQILAGAAFGRVFREGVTVAICGRPNVGKSSLLNAFLKQERSIVTHIAGTTRDTIEELINLKGIPVRLIDTAGMMRPRGIIERKAIQRSREYIDSADVVIFVFDGSKRLTGDDKTLMRRLKHKAGIAVLNKIDLRQLIERERIAKAFSETVAVSAKTLKNMHLLEEAIVRQVYAGKVKSPEPVLVSNIRHIQKLKKAQGFIGEAITSAADPHPLPFECIALDIKDSLAQLDELLGTRFDEDVLEKIFSRFCIGK